MLGALIWDGVLRGDVNPLDPIDAQRIVSDYARVLGEHSTQDVYPCSVASLPYSKETLKTSISTSVHALNAGDQMTDELREFLETAYVSLADYVDDELAKLMAEYRRASAELAEDTRLARDKVHTQAWKIVADSSRLVGQIARAIAEDTEALRREFRLLVDEQSIGAVQN